MGSQLTPEYVAVLRRMSGEEKWRAAFRLYWSARKLEQLGLRYMVSGSVAAIYYGEPRLTNDVDIVQCCPRRP